MGQERSSIEAKKLVYDRGPIRWGRFLLHLLAGTAVLVLCGTVAVGPAFGWWRGFLWIYGLWFLADLSTLHRFSGAFARKLAYATLASFVSATVLTSSLLLLHRLGL